MPRDEMRTRKPTDIYSVMLILAWVFLVGSILLTWHELDTHYDFLGSEVTAGELDEFDDGMGDTGVVDEGDADAADTLTEPE